MATTVYPNFLLSAKINRLHFMLPILFAILVSLICAQFVLLSEPIRNSTALFDGMSEFFVVISILVIVVLSIVSLFVFFRIFNKNPHFALRIVVAAFILGGMLSTLLFGKLVFSLLHLDSPLLLIVVAFVAYIGVYFAYLSIVDALSDRMKNLLFVFCSGSLGSFLGVLLPAVPVIGISLFLSVLDFLLIRRRTVENIVGEETYEKLVFNVAISNQEWGIGIGDLTCYSMVVSSTSVTFGFSIGVVSLMLILIGSLISLTLTLQRVRLPGLPIPIALGLIPLIMLLLFI
jgi:hypothetical protein